MQYTQKELDLILSDHKKWLEGKGGKRANLSRANLSGANLSWANLSGANLSWANLSGANLSGANLSRANLSGANLFWANLSWANLSGANLSRANLYGANLSRANLSGANLSEANLSETNLFRANLSKALNIPDKAIGLTSITPEGSLIGWKKCQDNVIVKLRIPEFARRSNATGRKCRAEYVEVLAVYGHTVGFSCYDGHSKYEVGYVIKSHAWEENRWIECAPGIHFFLTRQEAEDYNEL